MIATQGRFALSSWPAWLLVGIAVLAPAAWVMLYRLGRRLGAADAGQLGLFHNTRRLSILTARAAVGFCGAWAACHVLAVIFNLKTGWPLWPMAAAASGGAEALIWLYELERRIVSPRMGRLLTGLRLGLLALLILMFLQPVWQSARSRDHKRTLVVLVDVSRSMRVADRRLEPHEKLRLAEAFSIAPAERRYRLEADADALRGVRGALLVELTWLDRLARGTPEAAGVQLTARRKELNEKLSDCRRQVAGRIRAVEEVLKDAGGGPQAVKADLLQAKAMLGKHVVPNLADSVAFTDKAEAERLSADFPRLHKAVRRAVTELGNAAPILARVGQKLDGRQYEQLGSADRARVDAVAGLDRLALAKAVLLHPARPRGDDADDDAEPVPLLERLRDEYEVHVYTVASRLAEADPDKWADPIPAGAGKAGPASAPAAVSVPRDDETLRTDLGAALREVLGRFGGSDLAGVFVLSDGQNNGEENLEALARQLGGQGAAFCAAVIGSRRPPTDAAIVSLEAPETVFLADKMYVDADLKLDGLAGKKVRVTLYDGERAVDTRTIAVPGDIHRTRIQLGCEPRKPGLHSCRVEIEEIDGEVFTDNNVYGLTLSVVDDKTRVLLVDSRPRWEFRYLKNLFSGRDKTVFLQYVLLQPDRFTNQPPRPRVTARARREDKRPEATALPETEDEWMKFSVIVLGDVPRTHLSPETMEMIRKFVSDRGGTVVFIAGPRHMPGEYPGTPLAQLMPLDLAASGGAASAEQLKRRRSRLRRGFRLAPSPAGATHVVLRQDVDPRKSGEVWNSLPRIYWRSRFTRASRTGTVLAYALDADAPAWVASEKAPKAATSPETLRERRRQYRRSRALITTAPHGLGKVMMLSFDRTWRLRHRIGDTYHHKFWGQVLRWATEGELPAGTHLVKLGTDRTRYPPHSRPRVRAKIVREDFTPVETKLVVVKVFARDKLVRRVPMKYIQDSPGMYQATLDELPAGTYRLQLDAPVVTELLARDGVKKVSTDISVDPSAPTEEIELAANMDLMARLASLSRNGLAVPPYRAGAVLEALPSGPVRDSRREQFELWDSWPLLLLFCTVATVEWVLRKKVGLA